MSFEHWTNVKAVLGTACNDDSCYAGRFLTHYFKFGQQCRNEMLSLKSPYVPFTRYLQQCCVRNQCKKSACVVSPILVGEFL